MCYTYDSLSRVTKRTVKNLSNTVLSEEAFSYDAAGNITDAPDSCFAYDANNRLVVFDGNSVSYDLDGNLLSNGSLTCSYDSANKLISAGGHTYTYNAEDVRIRNLCAEEDTTYTYNTNAKLSKLLMKTTGGVVTKYSKDFANEKPVTFFASAGDNWWEFWKWSIGIDVNIDGYGGGISIGTESSINVHAGDVSHEVGVNALGRISHKIAHKVEDSFVYTKYSLNGPETAFVAIGVPVLIYFAPSLIPVIGAGVPALAGALG